MNRTLQVARAFSKAAQTYDQHDLVQKYVAQRLAEKILCREGNALGVVLDVGCGTGILGQCLSSYSNQYVLTDISLPLLKVAQEKVRGDHVSCLVVDAELPCFTASFDIIVSNLSLHWFQDPKVALTHLAACLKPGGRLYITTLGNNTFYEWRTAHMVVEASCGVLDFISFGQLKDWLPLSGTRHVEEEWLTTTPKDALEFLRGLKAMGGHFPHPGHRPLPMKTFKKVMNEYNQMPKTSYQILYGAYQKPQKMREE